MSYLLNFNYTEIYVLYYIILFMIYGIINNNLIYISNNMFNSNYIFLFILFHINIICIIINNIMNYKNILYLLFFLYTQSEANLIFQLNLLFISLIIYISIYHTSKYLNIFFFEISLLLIFLLYSIICLININNSIIFIIFIEIQNFCIYTLISINNRIKYSLESSLKYFILSSFSSMLFLLSITFYYGLSGLYYFYDIYSYYLINLYNILNTSISYLTIYIGYLCFLLGFLFKIYSAPFHFWVVDIYQGTSLNIILIISVLYYIAIILLFIKFFNIFFNYINFLNTPIFYISCIFSILSSIIGGVYQQHIKKLIAFSSINSSGIILFLLITNNIISIIYINSYIFIYTLNILNIFIIISIYYFNNNYYIDNIYEFIYLIQSEKNIIFTLLISLFSLSNVPPLYGFFVKIDMNLIYIYEYYIYIQLFLILAAIFSNFIYLKIITSIYYNFINNTIYYIFKIKNIFLKQKNIFYFFIIYNITYLNILFTIRPEIINILFIYSNLYYLIN